MEKILIYLACFYCFNLAAKPSFDTLSIIDNSKLLRLESKKQSIYIFCPINSFTKEIYLEKFDKLFKKSKIQALDSLDFKLIFYKRSTNKSKGLNIYFSYLDSLVLVNEFEVYFQNFDREKVYKTSLRSEIVKRYITSFISDSNLSKVDISENVSCFNNLAERIPEYENFISQLINPIYSDAEKIIILNQELNNQKNKIDSIVKVYQTLQKDIIQLTNRIENLENPKPIENPKSDKKETITPVFKKKDEKSN